MKKKRNEIEKQKAQLERTDVICNNQLVRNAYE